MNRKIIGLTGFARVGKDTFYKIASDILESEYGLRTKRYALADALKGDIREFVLDKVGIDVFTDNVEDKNVIRPLLVAYGKCKRIQSQAKYWTSILQQQIEFDTESDIIFVTDIRYAEYPEDEIQWIKNIMDGKLIHISKYSQPFGVKEYVVAPNEDEANNDPVIRSYADILFEWEHNLNSDGNMDIEYMKSVVRPVIKSIIL